MADLCSCGCGREVKSGRKFLQGHHLRIKKTEIQSENIKVHIYPNFRNADTGEGGVRRVVEGQQKYLSKYGIDVVDSAEEADIIACHIEAPPPYLKLYPNKPLVGMCHGLYWSEYIWENWSLKANQKVMELIRVADVVTAPSDWVANSILRHSNRRVVIIPHGVEVSEWNPGEAEVPYVLWNKTRVDPICDPEPLNQVASIMPDVHFVSTFGNEASNVTLTGRLGFEQAKSLIENAAVYLCTSRETFGIGTLEAMAAGVPVVAFNFGGQAEFLTHKYDSWLANPGDIEGLKEGIVWALENREEAGAAALKTAKQFTWERASVAYAKLFREIYDNKLEKQPRTSIIVTNYNLHEYVKDCLDSIRNQSDADWECIFVDDASTDRSGVELAKEYAASDNRFKVIENQENVYLAEARNIGIREAKGKYILPLDADDMIAPETIQVLANALDDDRSIHIAYGNVYFVNEDGITATIYDQRHSPGHSGWPMNFQFEWQMMQRNLLPYCSMFRREAWQSVGGYRRRQRTAEDAEFWSRLSSYGFTPKMVTTVDTLIYRNRDNSMSRIQSGTNWAGWFSWASNENLTPAGACTKDQMPISSLDPAVISVVIPVGPGHQKYVHDAIDSVEAQTFLYWECIVVNDTGAMLPELPLWVKVINPDGNNRYGSPAAARNAGIEASKGRLFLPLDADDYLEPIALEAMFHAYQDTKDVIYCDFWQTDSTGTQYTVHQCDDYDPIYLTGGKRIGPDGLAREGMMHSVTALTPKEVWKEVGGYDEEIPGWEDWDFQLSIADKGVCSSRVAMPLFTYRKHTGFRREENYATFEESKEGILRKWNKLWEGGEQLMACGSCGARRSVVPDSSIWSGINKAAKNASNDNAVKIEYIGLKSGATPYRGSSGTTYWFAKGESKWVLQQDLNLFMSRPNEFKVASIAAEVGDQPVLVAEGPPIG